MGTLPNRLNSKSFHALLLVLCNLVLSQCFAAPRALLVGVADYPRSPLESPPRDIRLIGDSLKQQGWQITLLENPSSTALRQAVSSFAAASKSRDLPVLLYFSGHGMQSRGENYLLPVDISGSMAEVLKKSLSLSEIFRSLSGTAAPKIVIVDACRNDPLGRASVAVSVGLNSQYAPSNSLIAYATSPGEYALDGDAGKGSPYAISLASALIKHDSFDEVFREVRRGTLKRTNGKQLPWESSSLIERVSSVSGGGAAAVAKVKPPVSTADRVSIPSPVFIEKINSAENPVAEAVAYLTALAAGAPEDSFWQWSGETESRLRNDIVNSLHEIKKSSPRFAIYRLATALQTGRLYSNCKKGVGIESSCMDFDRAFIFEPNLELALKLSQVASAKRWTSEPLANHYKNGWLVDRDLLAAYDLYIEDSKLGGEYATVNVNQMVQNILVRNGEKLTVDGDFGPASCAAMRRLIGETKCAQRVSRDQLRSLVAALE